MTSPKAFFCNPALLILNLFSVLMCRYISDVSFNIAKFVIQYWLLSVSIHWNGQFSEHGFSNLSNLSNFIPKSNYKKLVSWYFCSDTQYYYLVVSHIPKIHNVYTHYLFHSPVPGFIGQRGLSHDPNSLSIQQLQKVFLVILQKSTSNHSSKEG